MGLPRPDPFGLPETPEEFLSDYLLHAAVAAGTVIGVYAYTGLYAGPGITGTIYMAMFSTAEVGAAGAGSVALADTAYAMSVYAEPFIAAARFVGPIAAAAGVSYLARGDEQVRAASNLRVQSFGQSLGFKM